MQALRRNPFRHPKSKHADLVLCLLGLSWWIASAVVLSVWADAANRGGLPSKDWRNGACVLAWAQVIFWTGLAATSALLITAKSQGLFNKYAAKQAARKQVHCFSCIHTSHAASLHHQHMMCCSHSLFGLQDASSSAGSSSCSCSLCANARMCCAHCLLIHAAPCCAVQCPACLRVLLSQL